MLNELQQTELETMKFVDNMCKKHNLPYFMVEGSLLGAVRHQGFIPWDDDIDIALFRSDYEKFKKIAKNELTSPLWLSDLTNCREEYLPFLQVQNSSIQVKKTSGTVTFLKNSWIDIFPIDGLPNSILKRKLHLFKILYYRLKSQFSQFDESVDIRKKNRPLLEKILIFLGKNLKIGRKWDTVKIFNKLDSLLKKYPPETSNLVFLPYSAYKTRAVYRKEWFLPGKKLVFEELLLSAPQEPEKVLIQTYGDYMTPPPENERQGHLHLDD